MKGKTCCVTGHRDLPQKEINHVKAALRREIDCAVADGFTRLTVLSPCCWVWYMIPNQRPTSCGCVMRTVIENVKSEYALSVSMRYSAP